MFQREALWISFVTYCGIQAAVKVSVGGGWFAVAAYYVPLGLNNFRWSEVNAISGAAKDGPAPPSIDQDYIVAGHQPWLDGIMTESGVVRQVSSKLYVSLYKYMY